MRGAQVAGGSGVRGGQWPSGQLHRASRFFHVADGKPAPQFKLTVSRAFSNTLEKPESFKECPHEDEVSVRLPAGGPAVLAAGDTRRHSGRAAGSGAARG